MYLKLIFIYVNISYLNFMDLNTKIKNASKFDNRFKVNDNLNKKIELILEIYKNKFLTQLEKEIK